MGADTAGAALRPGLLSAAWGRAFGSPRIRSAAIILSAILFVTGGVAAAKLIWPGGREADHAVPSRAIDRLDLVASVVAYELQLAAGKDTLTAQHVSSLKGRLPPLALADQRTAYVSDWHGTLVASTGDLMPRRMSDLLMDDEATTVDQAGRVARARLRDGTPVLVAVRNLPSGHVAVVQPYETARRDGHIAYLHEALSVTCVVALAGLGAGGFRYRRNLRMNRLRRTRTSRLDTSMSHGRCGVWDWDTTRHRVFWSASMYELLGYEPRGEHLSAGEVIALLHPEDGGVRDLLAALTSQVAGELDREIRVRTAKGEWLWLRIKGETIREPADGSRHMIGLAVDVTEERLAAERRASDDLRLREAVEALPEAFVLWDPEDRLIVCNSKFLALNGIDADIAAPGTPSREIMAAAKPALLTRPLDVARSDVEDGRKMETQVADGRWFHISERRTRDGGTVSVGTDVSELKRKEAKLRARAHHLQDSVQLAQTAAQCFAVAAERSHEANAAKTEFLARVSHELRTPLNAILGFSEVMCRQELGPLDARYSSYPAAIHTSGVKLLEMIDGILQISKIEKGQTEFCPEIVDLTEIVRDVVASFDAEAESKALDIEADIDGPHLLEADGAAIREILFQVVRNAVKFSTCDGRVRVRVRSSLDRLNVFVEDSGIGISPEMLPEIGRPFPQAESEYARACGGAGLGLAVVHSLLQLHGGRFSVRSQPGIGTIALVSLPKAQPAANDTTVEAPAPMPMLMAAE